MRIKKIRLDKLLVDRGIASTVEKAQALILARAIKVNNEFIDKAGTLISQDAEIQIKGNDNPYVSRGGLKLIDKNFLFVSRSIFGSLLCVKEILATRCGMLCE